MDRGSLGPGIGELPEKPVREPQALESTSFVNFRRKKAPVYPDEIASISLKALKNLFCETDHICLVSVLS
ncbi:hypothetical protein EK904_007694 [Melospiza melodia maxima]|nr:hypothetical protein EK904_007694 [Melospiza melodia maxima]